MVSTSNKKKLRKRVLKLFSEIKKIPRKLVNIAKTITTDDQRLTWNQKAREDDLKKYELDAKRFKFMNQLLRLEICLAGTEKNSSRFYAVKQEVLENELINCPEYKELKEWIETLKPGEKDFSKLEEVLNSYTKTK